MLEDRELIDHGVAVLVAALALLVLAWVKERLGRVWTRARARKRSARALRGEKRAEPLLERHGFVVEARQEPVVWTVRVDGKEHDVGLRADLLVSRQGARYVAEVKTGQVAPHIGSAATRRQLLEYRLAYDVDGVLLVDVEAGRVSAIEFPLPHEPATMPRSPLTRVAMWFVLVFAAGAVAGLAVASWLPR